MPKKASPTKKKLATTTSASKTKSIKKVPIRGSNQDKVKISKPDNSIKPKLPNVYNLAKNSWQLIWHHRKLFFCLTIIYGILNLILAQGLASSGNISTLKNGLSGGSNGGLGNIASSLGVFIVLASSGGNSSSQTAGAYQVFLSVITSLAVIWSLREVFLEKAVSIKQAYYKGMYPLIPFILVLLMILVQLLPFILGTLLYSVVLSNGIAVNLIEKIAFGLITLLLVGWSIYMVSSSIFALYIVTLPDETPKNALKSAKDLVKGRRISVFRKIIALPVILILIAGIIMLPIIMFITPLAQWVFFILTMFGLVAVHTYMYTLYRELLA